MSRNWKPRGTKGPPIRNPKLNENKDDFNGVRVVAGGQIVGKITHIDLDQQHMEKTLKRCFELPPPPAEGYVSGSAKGYSESPLRAIIKDLIYLDMLKAARAQYFFYRHEHLFTMDEREAFMEKYGVKIDPKKTEKEKRGASGEKPKGIDDPNVNVPKDPDLGTEPYEENPEDG